MFFVARQHGLILLQGSSSGWATSKPQFASIFSVTVGNLNNHTQQYTQKMIIKRLKIGRVTKGMLKNFQNTILKS